jgi:hypothetical protein
MRQQGLRIKSGIYERRILVKNSADCTKRKAHNYQLRDFPKDGNDKTVLQHDACCVSLMAMENYEPLLLFLRVRVVQCVMLGHDEVIKPSRLSFMATH